MVKEGDTVDAGGAACVPVVEHRKKITKLQKKLVAEKERRKYFGCVALLSWMITHVRRHHMCYEMQLLQRMKC